MAKATALHASPTGESDSGGVLLCRLLAADAAAGDTYSGISRDQLKQVFELAVKTKTVGLLPDPAKSDVSEDLSDFGQALRTIRARQLHGNLANLAWTIRACGELEKVGVRPLVFKGPVRSQQVYGRWDARPCSDIDILVRPDDYHKACCGLTASGFEALVRKDSKWWHDHLGESPFVKREDGIIVLDLHHAVQQPGGPFPAHVEAFHRDSQTVQMGNGALTTLSSVHALLVTAISFGKALRSSGPWLAHAHELRTDAKAMGEEGFARVRAEAGRQGLSRLFDQAVESAQALFAEADEAAPDRQQMVASAMGMAGLDTFARTRWLWDWCDGAGLSRIAMFADGIWRIVRRDIAHFIEPDHEINLVPEPRTPATGGSATG